MLTANPLWTKSFADTCPREQESSVASPLTAMMADAKDAEVTCRWFEEVAYVAV